MFSSKPERFTGQGYDKRTHTFASPCPPKWSWCRVHWFPDYALGPIPYPVDQNYRSSRVPGGWIHVWVHCGPAAWLPKRPTYEQGVGMNAICAHKQMDLTCNMCLRFTFHPYEV